MLGFAKLDNNWDGQGGMLTFRISNSQRSSLNKGMPATEHRIVANMLLKKTTFYIDKFIESNTWDGLELVWYEN